MNKLWRITEILIALIFLVVVFMLGFQYKDEPHNETKNDATDMGMHDSVMHEGHSMEIPHGDHVHTLLEATAPYPAVSISVTPDPKSGWNVFIETENHTFAPERASTVHIPGEGHAHIYVNGQKINRIYGNWYHLNELPVGEHEIMVSLSTNDHQELVRNGIPIMAMQTIVVQE